MLVFVDENFEDFRCELIRIFQEYFDIEKNYFVVSNVS